MKKMKAFTLAEILITLSIIGVVAALTIPTLVQRTGNEENVSRLMKAYSTLSQATEAIITENGGVKTWATDVDSIFNLYKSHLRNAKECGSSKDCFKQLTSKGYMLLNGKFENWDYNTINSYRKLILSDGTQIAFDYRSNACDTNYGGSKDYCSAIFVDTNGEKGPNIDGRDFFTFVLKADGLYPRGCDDESYCVKADGSFGTGYGCACKVIREGAMNY